MRGLVEPDCGGVNPLVRLTNRYTADRARVAEGVGSSTSREAVGEGRVSSQGLVREFLAETREVAARPSHTFRMDSLLSEMRQIEGRQLQPRPGPGVAVLARTGESWANEFVDSDQNVIDWSREYLATHSLAGPDPLAELPSSQLHPVPADVRWAEDYLADVPVLEEAPVLRAEEFEQFMASVGQQSTGRQSEASEVVKEAAQVGAEGALAAGTEWAEEFADLTSADAALHPDTAEGREAYKRDFWKSLEDDWKEAADADHPWLNEFSSSYEPFKDYEFREENPLAETSNPLEEGKQRLEAGDLPSAVLLFEAAARQDPDSAEVWQLLGTSQAENEQDPQAIAALKRCLRLDPGNTSALMALAVSYTNESYQAQACGALADWLRHQPEYSSLAPKALENFNLASSFMSKELHEKTTSAYIAAARQGQGRGVDPDIQAGLGVLFNLSGEYDKAVDCFRAAVSARPTDALLWNRLGATLANGNRSEEAVAAYHTALRTSPGFLRCRYNLGISCINLKAYSEAAEHFLTTLNFQAAGRGPQGDESRAAMSDSVWSSLRLAISLLRRQDLLPHLDARNLSRLSREFGLQEGSSAVDST